MILKLVQTSIFIIILTGCSSDIPKESTSKLPGIIKTVNKDTSEIVVVSKHNGLELFIDSMKNTNYLIDTNRLKQVIWSDIAKYPKSFDKGHIAIQAPFPIEKYQPHFSDSKTYFFAKWNETEKTFKHGNDYLLMTWTIDSLGIKEEKEMYTALHEYMGNFPCYIFRSKNTVYAMSHRMTVHASQTRKLTEQLRNYIDKSSLIYSPYNGAEPK
ncbi:MAG: hypothetical protein ACK50L_03600 [Bacteroidota bacterium]